MFLEISGIKKSFGEGESRVEVLKGIDAQIEKGEFTVLLGPSGSGKSTLLNIIGGIDSADEGYISINGEKTRDMNEKALTLYRRKHLGYIFQMYNLIPNLNIKENIEVGAYLSDSPLDVDELLKALGLYEHRHKLPNQLSGGQQQRTAIGRAVIKNPDILLCDEPTGALDYKTSKEILGIIGDMNTMFTLVKGLPLTYNRDLQEDKPAVFDAYEQAMVCLDVVAGALSRAEFNAQKCTAAVADPLLLATDLADYLVMRGVAFRKAHHYVGGLVALAEKTNTPINELSDAAAKKVCPHLGEDWKSVFDLKRAISMREKAGMPGKKQTAKRIAYWKKLLAK